MRPVDNHGLLRISGTDIVDANNQIIRLRGLSSHGLQWYPDFINLSTLIEMRDEWGLNIIRLAMYVTQNGYCDGNPGIKEMLFYKVQCAIAAGIYCIIDWHMLGEGNPMTRLTEASSFFCEVAAKYAGVPNVLFEICNEPNGSDVQWDNAVRPYASQICDIIRQHSPGIIIVGNPNWSQRPNAAIKTPINDFNIMYTLHWYAGTHYQDIRDNLQQAHDAGLAVFVTEWSISDAQETKVDMANAATWMELMDKLGLSWTSWSLCDKWEPSSILYPGTNPSGPYDNKVLTGAGLYVRNCLVR